MAIKTNLLSKHKNRDDGDKNWENYWGIWTNLPFNVTKSCYLKSCVDSKYDGAFKILTETEITSDRFQFVRPFQNVSIQYAACVLVLSGLLIVVMRCIFVRCNIHLKGFAGRILQSSTVLEFLAGRGYGKGQVIKKCSILTQLRCIHLQMKARKKI